MSIAAIKENTSSALAETAQNTAKLLKEFNEASLDKIKELADETAAAVNRLYLELLDRDQKLTSIQELSEEEREILKELYERRFRPTYFENPRNTLLYNHEAYQKKPVEAIVDGIVKSVENTGTITNGQIASMLSAYERSPYESEENMTAAQKEVFNSSQALRKGVDNNLNDQYRVDFRDPTHYTMSDETTNAMVQFQEAIEHRQAEIAQEAEQNRQQQNDRSQESQNTAQQAIQIDRKSSQQM